MTYQQRLDYSGEHLIRDSGGAGKLLMIRELKTVEESYGTDMHTLSIACGHVEHMFSNPPIVKHLEKHYSDIFGERHRRSARQILNRRSTEYAMS